MWTRRRPARSTTRSRARSLRRRRRRCRSASSRRRIYQSCRNSTTTPEEEGIMNRRHFTLAAVAAPVPTWGFLAAIDHRKARPPGKVGGGFPPPHTQAWAGGVMSGEKFFEKYPPKGSGVAF